MFNQMRRQFDLLTYHVHRNRIGVYSCINAMQGRVSYCELGLSDQYSQMDRFSDDYNLNNGLSLTAFSLTAGGRRGREREERGKRNTIIVNKEYVAPLSFSLSRPLSLSVASLSLSLSPSLSRPECGCERLGERERERP